ncbi:PHA/PHB synthase family protein [Halovulum sp. GXIMD14793]
MTDRDETLIEQSSEFAANLSEIVETTQQIWVEFLASEPDEAVRTRPDPLNIFPAWAEMWRSAFDHPHEMAEATLQYWSAQMELWQAASLKWLGAEAPPMPDLPHMAAPGKRFAHKDWSENAVFEYIKHSYLLTAGWLNDTVHSLPNMPAREQKKVEFYTRNLVEAMNPANFFALNPEVLETTLAEKGENLVRGLQMMLADLQRGKGQLLIRQTDMDAFEVGRDMAMTEGQVVWQNSILQLIQYTPTTDKVYRLPLLIVPPWINKFYILDLNPKKSMIRWLVDQGHTVFVISWVNPDSQQKDETWDSYFRDGVLAAIDKVLEECGTKQTHLASYCIGGTMTGSVMAYLGKTGGKRVASATFFAAQLDFTDAGELQVFVDDQTIGLVDDEMEKGFLPAQKMATAFNMLRANDLIWSYMVNNYMLGKDPMPFDLLYWNADSTAMPAKLHHFYLDTFYNRNAFAADQLAVLDTPVRLSDIKGPVYHVATREDHIAPAASVFRGAQKMTAANVRFVLAGSGHIAGVVNPPAAGKYQYWTNADMSAECIDSWLDGATETSGSWWPDWHDWLAEKSRRMVAARTPGKVLGVVEPAPGTYVKIRFDQR